MKGKEEGQKPNKTNLAQLSDSLVSNLVCFHVESLDGVLSREQGRQGGGSFVCDLVVAHIHLLNRLVGRQDSGKQLGALARQVVARQIQHANGALGQTLTNGIHIVIRQLALGEGHNVHILQKGQDLSNGVESRARNGSVVKIDGRAIGRSVAQIQHTHVRTNLLGFGGSQVGKVNNSTIQQSSPVLAILLGQGRNIELLARSKLQLDL